MLEGYGEIAGSRSALGAGLLRPCRTQLLQELDRHLTGRLDAGWPARSHPSPQAGELGPGYLGILAVRVLLDEQVRHPVLVLPSQKRLRREDVRPLRLLVRAPDGEDQVARPGETAKTRGPREPDV